MSDIDFSQPVQSGKQSGKVVTTQPHLVVIGAGMAGTRFAFNLAKAQAHLPDDKRYAITLINSEPYAGYNRIMLSPVLAGEKDFKTLALFTEAQYTEHQITLKTHTSVTAIDLEHKVLTFEHTQTIDTAQSDKPDNRICYDKLVFATGSTPFMLPLPNADAQGVLAFRTKQDVDNMLAIAKRQGSRCVVIGGGLLGLEAANALANHGAQVTVVHIGEYLLERQLDNTAADLLQTHFEQKGIEFCLQGFSESIEVNERYEVTGLRLKDGTVIGADCLVMAVGVRPNIALAKEAGVPCERGIVVDGHMQTECDDVYAIGECVQFETHVFGLVAPVYAQAEVLANSLIHDLNANQTPISMSDKQGEMSSSVCNKPAPFAMTATATKLKVSGVDLFSAGDIFAIETEAKTKAKAQNTTGDKVKNTATPKTTLQKLAKGHANKAHGGYEFVQYHDLQHNIYQKLTIKNNKLVGAVLYGDVSNGAWFFELMQQQTDIGAYRHQLLFGQAFCHVA